MSMNVGSSSSEEPEVLMDINTTPLIDVMLVLLVMLIITIPIQLHSVNLEMPVGAPPTNNIKPEKVQIDIDERSVVYWQGLPVNAQELEAKMKEMALAQNQPEVHLRPGAHVGTLAWIVEDRNLNQALDAALKFAQNVTIVHGRATRLESGAAGATVHLDGGAAIACALVVGADGAQSWVRGQCDIGLDYRSYGQRAVVTNFACALPHHGAAHQWFTGADGIVALLPLPGRQVSLVWSAPDALAEALRSETATQLAARVSVLCARQLGALTPLQPELVRDFPLLLMRPHAVTAPRVALVGDAAHVVHPLSGHGMNLGFADVAELIAVIAAREAQRAIGDERVLARYARARKEDVLLMQLATDGLTRLFGSDIEPLRAVRNLGLNLLDKLPGLKRRLISHAMGKEG